MQPSHHALPATSNGFHGWLICTINLVQPLLTKRYLFKLGTVPGGVLAKTLTNSSIKAYLVCGDGCGCCPLWIKQKNTTDMASTLVASFKDTNPMVLSLKATMDMVCTVLDGALFSLAQSSLDR